MKTRYEKFKSAINHVKHAFNNYYFISGRGYGVDGTIEEKIALGLENYRHDEFRSMIDESIGKCASWEVDSITRDPVWEPDGWIGRFCKDEGYALVLPKSGHSKYIVAEMEGKEIIVALPASRHYEIVREMERKTGKKLDWVRGGHLRTKTEGKKTTVEIYGSSGDYGQANHEDTKKVLDSLIGIEAYVRR
jgi:hypothetical protein